VIACNKMTLTQQILAEFTVINVAITLAITLVVIPMGVWIYDKYRFRALPPGPPTRPFIGNKHLIPASRPWLKMAEWSETYVCPTLLFVLMEGTDLYTLARKITYHSHFRSCYRSRSHGKTIPDLFFETKDDCHG
jgi:hypothetical protein